MTTQQVQTALTALGLGHPSPQQTVVVQKPAESERGLTNRSTTSDWARRLALRGREVRRAGGEGGGGEELGLAWGNC